MATIGISITAELEASYDMSEETLRLARNCWDRVTEDLEARLATAIKERCPDVKLKFGSIEEEEY